MKKELLAAAALTALIGVGFSANAAEEKSEKEKCYGVVKAGKNDCAAADKSNSCAGAGKKDGDKNAWVYLPAGLCDKLVGGSTKAGS